MTTICVADDDRIALRLMTAILTRAGYRVITAVDGQSALEQMTETPVDLLIADIDMPRMDGLSLLHRMQMDDNLRAIPAIVLTAGAENQMFQQASQAGAEMVLTKPVSSQNLLTIIAGLLAKQPTKM